MKTYKKIGTIDSFDEIPWDKLVVVTGGIGRDAWLWRVPGVFEKNNGKPRFRDRNGMNIYFSENVRIGLNVFEANE